MKSVGKNIGDIKSVTEVEVTCHKYGNVTNF
jgi:hypothetical protein